MAAATSSRSTAERRLLLAVALAAAALLTAPCSADGGHREVHLHFYMHDGPPTSMRVVKGPGPAIPAGGHFGDTMVIDDVLTEGPSLMSSRAVGRAQGTYVVASVEFPVLLVSMTVWLTDGPYNGSTVVIAGKDNVLDEVRELAVVGGTGLLRRATGYVLWKTAVVVGSDVVLELDVHATVPDPSAGGGSSAAK